MSTAANIANIANITHLPASTPAPRSLSLILQATKETNHLLDLHTLARLHLLSHDLPDTGLAPLADTAIAAESATDSPFPAESATASDSPPPPWGGAGGGVSGKNGNRRIYGTGLPGGVYWASVLVGAATPQSGRIGNHRRRRISRGDRKPANLHPKIPSPFPALGTGPDIPPETATVAGSPARSEGLGVGSPW